VDRLLFQALAAPVTFDAVMVRFAGSMKSGPRGL